MLNVKSFGVIDKDKIKGNIHIVGVGALGSRIAENLIRLNLTSKIIVYDMDVVEEKNVNNQAYTQKHIGMAKVDAMKAIALDIDPDATLRIKNKKVEYIRTKDNDVVILALDSYSARASILSQIEGQPLVITGGISSIGGNFEVVRGTEKYGRLATEYASLPDDQEYDENDLTPCGSPISIFHRIGYAAALMAEEVVKNYNNPTEVDANTMFDVPNKSLFTV